MKWIPLLVNPDFFPPIPPHVLSDFVVPPQLWLKCNLLLRLGRPIGAVTLSRWEWWWNERWIWDARGGIKDTLLQVIAIKTKAHKTTKNDTRHRIPSRFIFRQSKTQSRASTNTTFLVLQYYCNTPTFVFWIPWKWSLGAETRRNFTYHAWF